jgi:hypothetical protein
MLRRTRSTPSSIDIVSPSAARRARVTRADIARSIERDDEAPSPSNDTTFNGEAEAISPRHPMANDEHERSNAHEIKDDDLRSLPDAPRRPSDADPAPRAVRGYPVFVHRELLERLEDRTLSSEIQRSFAQRLREIVVYGKSTRRKATRGPNKGWRRVPLGGNSGHHFYLWMLEAGDRIAGQEVRALYDALPPCARLLRTIRHHDETDHRVKLPVGEPDDYVQWTSDEIFAPPERSLLPDPSTLEQQRVRDARARLRLIRGQPGAGKTNALCASAERLEGRALYLTFSPRLVEQSESWFNVAAPSSLRVTARAWRSLLEELTPARPVEACSYEEAVREFAEHVRRARLELGPWRKEGVVFAHELFAELYANYYGAALPVAFRGRAPSRDGRMSDDAYAAARQSLGPSAIKHALRVARSIDDERADRWFFGPRRAFAIARALLDGALSLDPARWAFEHVLVDEVQDLTWIEQWLLLDLSARFGVAAGVKPTVIIAGDESQTVRPTSFDWGVFSTLATQRLGAKELGVKSDDDLSDNLRAPHEVAVFVNGLRRALYGKLDKRQRPRGRTAAERPDATVGRVIAVETPDDAALREAMRCFGDTKSVAALVYPAATVSEKIKQIAEEVGVDVYTSEQVKGLEFDVVGVFDVPATIEQIESLAKSTDRCGLKAELSRTTIDRLIVALSRSAETLVLFSTQWGPSELAKLNACHRAGDVNDSKDHVNDDEARWTVLFSLSELRDWLDADAADAREKVDALVAQCEQALERRAFDEAERHARAACSLLGKAGQPGAANPEQRQRARRAMGRALMAMGLDRAASRVTLREAARQFSWADCSESKSVCAAMIKVLFESPEQLETMKALQALAEAWPRWADREAMLSRTALDVIANRIEQWAIATEPLARTKQGRETLLDAVEQFSEVARTHRERIAALRERLAQRVLRWVLENEPREFDALRMYVRDAREGLALDAAYAERGQRYRDAADFWRSYGDERAAVRCLRMAGDLEGACVSAERAGIEEAALLRWLLELQRHVAARPTGALLEREIEALRRWSDEAARSR